MVQHNSNSFSYIYIYYIYTRNPQIEYYVEAAMRDTISYIYIYIYANPTDRIFQAQKTEGFLHFWICRCCSFVYIYIYTRNPQIEYSIETIFGPGIFYLWISRIYIYIYETVINLIQKLKKHCIFCSWTILLSIYLFGIDFFCIYCSSTVFGICSLCTKCFLQTPPDYTDRIFWWTSSKKEDVFVVYSCIYWFMFSILYICVFFHSFIWLSICFFFNPSLFEGFFIYSLHWIFCIYFLLSIHLVYFPYIRSSRYFGLSFVLFLGLSIGLSIYLLGVDFLMYLLVHLFDVRALPTKVFLQTPPDFTDRIFRWSFHHSELL